jgi:predicted porin
VDICTKGDISFFGVEDFPDHNPAPPSIRGGLATSNPTGKDSNSVRGGLLPSSFQVGLSTHQLGMDIGVYLGIYTGGNNANVGLLNANNGGAPFGLGTAGIDFRQFFGTIGTPWFGTVKIGRDIGLFGSDAILNDLTLFGVGSPGNNFAPANTTLGRIGVGYIYADFIPQITYKSPTFGGLTGWVSVMTPLAPFAFSGDPTSANACLAGASLAAGTCNGWTNSNAPMVQGKLQYVTPLQWLTPDAKLTLSTSGLWERQQADCSTQATLPVDGTCIIGPVPPAAIVNLNGTPLNPNATVDAWAVDAFAMVDVWGWNLVAYGYTGKGVGTTALFFDGINAIGGARHSEGGYFQAAYTFKGGVFLPQDLTVGASWGISHLETANNDNFVVLTNCGQFGGPLTAAGGQSCLVKDNQSWIGFARYKLTKWVNLQAEYTATTAENQIGQKIRDDAIAVGTTFFW